MEESYLDTEEFRKEIQKVSAKSDYKYRSIFDPAPSSEIKSVFNKNKK